MAIHADDISGWMRDMDVQPRVGVYQPVLDVAIDLGPMPPVVRVTECISAVTGVWVRSALVAGVRLASPPSEVGSPKRVSIRHSLVVRRMSLSSPWEALLTVAAEKSAPLLYAGAAMVALQRLLQMVMEWQRHRLDVADRRLRIEAVQLLRQHATEVRRDGGPASEIEPSSEALAALVTLAQLPIVRAEIQSEEQTD